METKHTKGKWKQSHRAVGNEGMYSTQVYTDKTVICTLDWAGHKEDDGRTITSRRGANAKLIAQSPIMYNYIVKKAGQGCNDAKQILATL